MAWALPKYSRDEVDAAGRTLIDPRHTYELVRALDVIDNWRSSHSFPLNTFQIGLRDRARQVGGRGVVAQRLKRISSIAAKLRRFRDLTLSEMQDIGGCRAVVSSVARVDQLVQSYRDSGVKHVECDADDYIRTPKPSGYRGVHLIYSYHSDKKETYNGLKVEVQIRSPQQHAWATAVETVDIFTSQALKSGGGAQDWRRFFKLMGTDMALRERTAPVPGTPTSRGPLRDEIRHHVNTLDVERRLMLFGSTLRDRPKFFGKDVDYFLLELEMDTEPPQVTVFGYRRTELELANDHYIATERKHEGRKADAVLVSVASIAALRRAYPNYFLDTSIFLDTVKRAVGSDT
jgi:hypothetical protein